MGFLMLVGPVCMMIIAPLSDRLSDQLGAQLLTAAGLGLMSLGAFYAAQFDQLTPYWSIIVSQALFGLGNGTFQAPNNSVMSAVVPEKLGMAGGINALARHLGLAAGTSASMAIIEQQRRTALNPLVEGFQLVMLAAAVFGAIGVMISYQRAQSTVVPTKPDTSRESASGG
jgi:MFS family permease